MNVIDEVIKNTKQVIIKDIDTESIDIILDGYRKYLENNYKNVLVNSDSDEKKIRIISQIETENFNTMSANSKKYKLIRDENLEKLTSLSLSGKSYALNKIEENEKISAEFANKRISEMQELFDNLYEYSKENANWLLSEGIMDYLFASDQTENRSIRVGSYGIGRH